MVIHYKECFGCLSHNYMWRWELLSPREAQLIPSQSVLAYFSKQVKLRAVLWLETMGANHGTVHMTSELQRQLVQVFWSTGCGGFTEGRGRDLKHCLFRVELLWNCLNDMPLLLQENTEMRLKDGTEMGGSVGGRGCEAEEEKWGIFIPKRDYFLKQGSAGFFKDININCFRLCGLHGHCSMDNQ